MRAKPHHTADELRALIRSEKRARMVRRLQAVLAALEGETADAIGERVQMVDRTVHDWVSRYNASGLDGLIDKPGRGRKKPLTDEQEVKFKARIRAGATAGDNVCTLRGEDVRKILKDEFEVVRGLQATYDLLHSLGFSCLRPRPKHPQADPAIQEEFRKKRQRRSQKSRLPIPVKPSKSGSRTRPDSVKKEP